MSASKPISHRPQRPRTPRHLARRLASARAPVHLLVACVCAVLCGCASPSPDAPAAPGEHRFYAVEARKVLAAAEELLLSRGYVFEENELDLGILVGQQVERVARGRGSIIKGTLVKTQVVVEAAMESGGTDLLVSFNINSERPTGERRSFSSETPQARRLREDFYSELELQLGVGFATQR